MKAVNESVTGHVVEANFSKRVLNAHDQDHHSSILWLKMGGGCLASFACLCYDRCYDPNSYRDLYNPYLDYGHPAHICEMGGNCWMMKDHDHARGVNLHVVVSEVEVDRSLKCRKVVALEVQLLLLPSLDPLDVATCKG